MPEGLNLGGERSMGATPAGSGLRPFGVEPLAASQAEPLVPSARLYIDCEFDGHGGPLLSIAIVAEDGLAMHLKTGVSPMDPWVNENVVPLLDLHEADVAGTVAPNEVGYHLRKFIDCERPVIVADSPVDIGRFCAAISTGEDGGWISTGYPQMTFEVHNVDCYPTDLPGAVQHNAYWDAMALRHKLASAMSTGTAKTPQAVEGRSPASAARKGTPKDPQESNQ